MNRILAMSGWTPRKLIMIKKQNEKMEKEMRLRNQVNKEEGREYLSEEELNAKIEFAKRKSLFKVMDPAEFIIEGFLP